jgi:hypothetical protein
VSVRLVIPGTPVPLSRSRTSSGRHYLPRRSRQYRELGPGDYDIEAMRRAASPERVAELARAAMASREGQWFVGEIMAKTGKSHEEALAGARHFVDFHAQELLEEKARAGAPPEEDDASGVAVSAYLSWQRRETV